MIKTINLLLEDIGCQLEHNSESDVVVFRLNNFILDEEKTKPGHEHFAEHEVIEVYPTVEEVKQIIKALQEVLPDEEGCK